MNKTIGKIQRNSNKKLARELSKIRRNQKWKPKQKETNYALNEFNFYFIVFTIEFTPNFSVHRVCGNITPFYAQPVRFCRGCNNESLVADDHVP